ISLSMSDVNGIEINPDYCFMDTGSPHYSVFVENIDEIDVVEEGRKTRYNDRFREEGVNVNFLEMKDDPEGSGQVVLYVRTYERGVEDETLSCGTGMVAAALYASLKGISERNHPSTSLRVTASDQSHSERSRTICNVITPGGEVKVKFTRHQDNSFSNIRLEGPATFVYKGEIDV
ncbi:hypothetical protein JYU16_01235, partial [bacterium AH-315-M05]|nr:hypothetical protein [bacterium AH-315-M05]